MAEEKKLLEIENLRKYFPVNGIKGPGVQAVQDVSLYIKKGETLGLVGESGWKKPHWEERFFVSMSQLEERSFMMAKPFYDNPLDKDGKPLGKSKSCQKCFLTEEKCRSFFRIHPLPGQPSNDSW